MTHHEHQCGNIPASGISVLVAEDFLEDSEWAWCLVVERRATVQDLEDNPMLEEVGETVWQTAVGITHCPFCGQQLAEMVEGGRPLPAEYVHVDSSGWRLRFP